MQTLFESRKSTVNIVRWREPLRTARRHSGSSVMQSSARFGLTSLHFGMDKRGGDRTPLSWGIFNLMRPPPEPSAHSIDLAQRSFRDSLGAHPLYLSHVFRRRYFSRNSLRR